MPNFTIGRESYIIIYSRDAFILFPLMNSRKETRNETSTWENTILTTHSPDGCKSSRISGGRHKTVVWGGRSVPQLPIKIIILCNNPFSSACCKIFLIWSLSPLGKTFLACHARKQARAVSLSIRFNVVSLVSRIDYTQQLGESDENSMQRKSNTTTRQQHIGLFANTTKLRGLLHAISIHTYAFFGILQIVCVASCNLYFGFCTKRMKRV